MVFTGRREKERADRESLERDKQERRERAARLRERRVQLFVDVSQHLEEWINALMRILNTQKPIRYPHDSLRPLADKTPGLAGPMAQLAYDDMEGLWRTFEQDVINLSEAIDGWMELGEHDDTDMIEDAVVTLEEKGQALFESATQMSASLRAAVTKIDTD